MIGAAGCDVRANRLSASGRGPGGVFGSGAGVWVDAARCSRACVGLDVLGCSVIDLIHRRGVSVAVVTHTLFQSVDWASALQFRGVYTDFEHGFRARDCKGIAL